MKGKPSRHFKAYTLLVSPSVGICQEFASTMKILRKHQGI